MHVHVLAPISPILKHYCTINTFRDGQPVQQAPSGSVCLSSGRADKQGQPTPTVRRAHTYDHVTRTETSNRYRLHRENAHTRTTRRPPFFFFIFAYLWDATARPPFCPSLCGAPVFFEKDFRKGTTHNSLRWRRGTPPARRPPRFDHGKNYPCIDVSRQNIKRQPALFVAGR